ncbi:interleukin-2 receptor subunit beta [Morone saxatilis]|uniref:interleukin-2 receptor subunit beta n=1 Tax=Morone saxatilis TaxID=34816 RepID=UPI0015E2366E|nr:interleukin-2 receptor subunit beta [Morone saxatilis]
MSRIVVIAMKILWSLHVLVLLFSVESMHLHKGSQGLFCLNDYVNNVSCTWNGSVAPGVDCWISGVLKTRDQGARPYNIIQTCKLKQHRNSPPGCSFVFKGKIFNQYKRLPIRMECNGTLVENLTDYTPHDHVKMHPPGVPKVNLTANETWISWSAGSPVSYFITAFDFEVQITQKNQAWKDAITLNTQDLELKTPSWKLKGHCQVRVRVRQAKKPNSHWSNWSPATSWVGATDMVGTLQDQDWFLDQTSLIRWGVMFIFGLILVVMLVLYKSCMNRRLHRGKPLPNPSTYFHTLHSVHGGNLKKWLNPLSAPESFFRVQQCDQISPVELCESSDVVTSSAAFTSAVRHFKSYPSTGSDTSGVVDNSSSSSSSCFSNMGYFMSSSSSSSARTDPNPAYFTYQDDFHNLHNSRNLHLSLCPIFTSSATYESLKREPQSPDSGFGIGKEDEDDSEDKSAVDFEGEEVLKECSPLFILPLHLPSRMPPPSSPSPPPYTPSLTQVSSDSQPVDAPVAGAGESYAAWPLAGAMCRSSSMPVEPGKTGYLTLKELQTTFSNKSI